MKPSNIVGYKIIIGDSQPKLVPAKETKHLIFTRNIDYCPKFIQVHAMVAVGLDSYAADITRQVFEANGNTASIFIGLSVRNYETNTNKG